MRELIFIHGRAQQQKDSVALKKDWIEAFRKGLAKSGLALPIPETSIRFPYYGDTLFDLAAKKPPEQAAEIVVRGVEKADEQEKRFVLSVLNEILEKQGVTDEEIEQQLGPNAEVVERGILNWGWVQAALQVIDRKLPGGSGNSIALFTNDVYQYINNPVIHERINKGVRQAFTPNTSSVVVSHSLGTVVAYSMLREEAHAKNWKVPLFMTLGSPLAVTAIRARLAPIKHPVCAEKWYNAMDERDVVALYPLNKKHFKIDPEIENKTNVDNHTDNRHGIAGYLDDKDVAKRIHDALIAG
jgi:hypothetical protein